MIAINTILRFPLAILVCSAFAILTLWNTGQEFPPGIANARAIFVACVFLFVGLRLFAESRDQSFFARATEWSVGLMIATLLLFYAEMFDPTSLAAFIVAFISFAMVAPFIITKFDHKAMWYFLCRVGVGFVFSGLIALVLMAGTGLIILSLDYLFDVKNVHSYLWLSITCCSLVWPTLTMMQIPKDFSSNADDDFAARLRIVGNYILPTLWLAYALIINAYALRIAIAHSLPRGKVSALVLVLGVSGFLTYFLGDSDQESPAWPNRIMRKIFGFALVAPLVLMGIGLRTRIEDYGLTEWRYINVLLLLVMTIGVLHFVFRPRERMIRVVLCTLCVLSLASTIPPLSALELSVADQRIRLKNILERNEVLIDNRIHSDHPTLSKDDLKKISDALSFLQRRNRLVDVAEWLGRSPQVVTTTDFIKAMSIPLGVMTN